MNPEVLNSWKEIAAYLGRGVRTVQRWEQDLGLPVRRPRGKERSAVIALKADLDRWLHQSPQGDTVRVEGTGRERKEKLHVNTQRLRKRIHEILQCSARMQETVKATLALTALLRDQQAGLMRSRRVVFKDNQVLVTPAIQLDASSVEARGGTNARSALKSDPRKQ